MDEFFGFAEIASTEAKDQNAKLSPSLSVYRIWSTEKNVRVSVEEFPIFNVDSETGPIKSMKNVISPFWNVIDWISTNQKHEECTGTLV